MSWLRNKRYQSRAHWFEDHSRVSVCRRVTSSGVSASVAKRCRECLRHLGFEVEPASQDRVFPPRATVAPTLDDIREWLAARRAMGITWRKRRGPRLPVGPV